MFWSSGFLLEVGYELLLFLQKNILVNATSDVCIKHILFVTVKTYLYDLTCLKSFVNNKTFYFYF